MTKKNPKFLNFKKTFKNTIAISFEWKPLKFYFKNILKLKKNEQYFC